MKINKDCVLRQLEEMSVLNSWDEVTMSHRWAIEALSRSLQDVLDCADKVFGGKVFVFSGDFRQVPPPALFASPYLTKSEADTARRSKEGSASDC
jgi:hypothetical protein